MGSIEEETEIRISIHSSNISPIAELKGLDNMYGFKFEVENDLYLDEYEMWLYEECLSQRLTWKNYSKSP
ncbi:hypothetical protein Glove_461g33 [Diversispora epigaea]|uniref:Uncharacterized protein n=1 Tax=Diversispora epigaea TaxID=1348612 RepID=A0A397GMZ0_9GLOM|nr:hypothetical protein Glove_461g33 [Diversispora epigaea]